jgi:deazaflavin-dependent oxidoreductase (nitroreductase family)
MLGSGAKRHVFHPLQKYLLNPLDNLAFRLGVPPPGDALLETIGRHTGKSRHTPVCDGLEGDTFWLLTQRGHDSDYVRNIEANPRVRVRVGKRWYTGTAHILDEDDPLERQRILCQGDFWRRLCLRASGAMSTSLLTVRIDLDPAP